MLASKPYIVALSVGLLVGLIYGALNVRSPAPPIVALVGLLGILLGEQAAALARRLVDDRPVTLGDVRRDCASHMFAALPHARNADERRSAAPLGGDRA